MFLKEDKEHVLRSQIGSAVLLPTIILPLYRTGLYPPQCVQLCFRPSSICKFFGQKFQT